MSFLSLAEAERALALANLLCVRADEGREVIISAEDLEVVALGLFLVVHVSEHASRITEFRMAGVAS